MSDKHLQGKRSFPKNGEGGPFLGDPNHKDYKIWGSTWVPSLLWKLPNVCRSLNRSSLCNPGSVGGDR